MPNEVPDLPLPGGDHRALGLAENATVEEVRAATFDVDQAVLDAKTRLTFVNDEIERIGERIASLKATRALNVLEVAKLERFIKAQTPRTYPNRKPRAKKAPDTVKPG